MKSSIQIQNEIRAIDENLKELSAQFSATEGDAQAAIHDSIVAANAKKDMFYEQLDEVVKAEDAMRKQGGVPVAAPVEKKEFKASNIAQAFLGDPRAFRGLSAADVNNMIKVRNEYQEFGVGQKTDTDYTFPRQTADNAPIFGIIDTLGTATTDADVLSYFVPDTTAYKNNAAKWKKGTAKPKSEMAWKKTSAYMETLAHYVPVSKLEMRDYGQLENVVNTELLYGLKAKKAAAVVSGAVDASNPGIVGLTASEDVLKYTASAEDTIADSAYKMATDVFLASGYVPTHVAMHPYVAEQVQLAKDGEGRYLNVVINGQLWALTVTPDSNLVDATGAKFGMMVYWNGGATVFTKHNDELSIGLVDDQFIRNEYTILAEGTYGLKIARPDAFSYLADTGVTGR